MGGKRYTTEDKEKARLAYEQEGLSIARISTETGASKRTVSRWAVDWVKRVDDPETEEQILRNRQDAQKFATEKMKERLQKESKIYEKSSTLLDEWLDFIAGLDDATKQAVFLDAKLMTRVTAAYAASSDRLERAALPHLDGAVDGRDLRIVISGVDPDNLK